MLYDANGIITRAGAEAAIRDGGSVLYKGTLRKTLADLPTETELAVGDPEATKKALDGLAAQRKALDEQEQKLLAANANNERVIKEAEAAEKTRKANEAKAQKEGAAPQRAAEGDDTGGESPVSDKPAPEAIEMVGRMRSKDQLQAVADHDKRSSVASAARDRLQSLP